jgi:OPT family oligopeptide transporter
MFTFGVVVIEVWETQLPVWAFVLALMIGGRFHICRAFFSNVTIRTFSLCVHCPCFQATANLQVGLNVISELVIGYTLPGRPIAMMMSKTWGNVTMSQGLFTSNLKLGRYMKIPPRSMFFCQVVGMVVAGTVQLGVQAWMFSNIEDLCSHNQKDGFTCPKISVFGSASIIVSYSCITVPLLNTVVVLVVGCHWTAAYVLAWSALSRPLVLLPCWCSCAAFPTDCTQEVQHSLLEVPPLPGHLLQHGSLASCDTAQLCALGASLLHI